MKICDFKGSFQKVSAKKYGIFHILVDTLTSLTYGKYTNDPTRPPYIWKIPNVFCRYFLKASLTIIIFDVDNISIFISVRRMHQLPFNCVEGY